MVYQVLNAEPDHWGLRLKHRDHLHNFDHEIGVLVLLVCLHDSNDLAVNDGATLSFNIFVILGSLVHDLVWRFLSNTRRDQLQTDCCVLELHVQSNRFIVFIKNWFFNLFGKNLHAWLAQRD